MAMYYRMKQINQGGRDSLKGYWVVLITIFALSVILLLLTKYKLDWLFDFIVGGAS